MITDEIQVRLVSWAVCNLIGSKVLRHDKTLVQQGLGINVFAELADMVYLAML